MKKQTNKCHFIPKVYLRKWHTQNKGNDKGILYCYDYINNQFKKTNGTNKLVLNDELFQRHRLYNQDYEDAVSKIENHYNSWLKDIVDFYDYMKSQKYTKPTDLHEDDTFWNKYFKFLQSCKRMVYFAFLQWIRYPDEKNRIILFQIFKEVMLYDDTHYLQLSAFDFIKINERKIIAFQNPEDKDIYKYAFGYLDIEKFNNIENSRFRILVDYSEKGEFVTSTNPVTPLFTTTDELPYGFLFPLSSNVAFRLVFKEGFEHYGDGEIFSIPCTAKREDIVRMNQTLLLYSPDSKIIAGNEYIAQNVFSGMRIATIQDVQNSVTKKIAQIKDKNDNTVEIEIPAEEEE